jgi:hypothetical protein
LKWRHAAGLGLKLVATVWDWLASSRSAWLTRLSGFVFAVDPTSAEASWRQHRDEAAHEKRTKTIDNFLVTVGL